MKMWVLIGWNKHMNKMEDKEDIFERLGDLSPFLVYLNCLTKYD